MSSQNDVLGYACFELFEEVYAYAENSCYLADSKASADEFMRNAGVGEEYRVEAVTLSRIMDDFGASCGDYVMEPEVWKRFQAAARQAAVEYESYADKRLPLMYVIVHDAKYREEE